jgi:phage terminase large subunit-like protein
MVSKFFGQVLTHGKGELAGKPFTLSDWQFNDIIRPMFGAINADGTRRYRTSYIEIPRKNGKSTLAAGIALYLLFGDGEPGAEVICAAADRDQASIVFDIAARMVMQSKLLSSLCTVLRKEIVTKDGRRMRAISADAHTKHGMSCSGIVFDEVHCQRDRELWDTLTTSTGARRNPLTVALTTAGYDRESLCYELHSYARGVTDGTIVDPTFLPVLYGAPDSDDWRLEATWRKANPGYGVSVRPEYFVQSVIEAQASPMREQAFRRLHLNQWTESSVRWVALDRWDACRGEMPDLAGRPCWAGLDLSTTTDLSALVLAFPVDDQVWLLPFCWAPKGCLRERERRNKTRYDQWAAAGHIELVDGDVIDYELIRSRITELGLKYQIRDIAIDRWNAAQLAQQLQMDGLSVVAFGQGYASMSPASKDFETLIMQKRIRHDGHPVLKWCLGNAVIEQDSAGNVKPSKGKSTEKIDVAIAAIMATARSRIGEVAGTSVYEGRGLSML